MITPTFYYHTGASIVQPDDPLRVVRYSWANNGGPDTAEIQVYSAENLALWRFVEMLRYHVTLNADNGAPVWWGYIHSVELHIGNRILTASLDDMYNHIQIHYNDPATSGAQAKTAAATDAQSIARYGYRDLIEQGTDIGTLAGAEAKRDLLLSIFRVPSIRRDLLNSNQENNYAVLRCNGWYRTLSWQYYVNASTANVVTTTQITNAITTAGQFITSTEIIDASGISTSEFRDGNDKARPIVEQLLEIGVSGGRRLRCTVTRDRRLVVSQEPANNNLRYYVDPANQLRDGYGALVRPELCTTGVWVGDKSILMPRGSEALSDPGAFFVDGAEYDTASGVTRYQPRGANNPLDVIRITRG